MSDQNAENLELSQAATVIGEHSKPGFSFKAQC